MPVPPSTWGTNIPITAHQLNQDLYSYDGSYFGANGVLFHSNRPLMSETFIGNSSWTATQGGAFLVLGGFPGQAISVIDNAALFGVGADNPGDEATFQSQGAIAPGSSGIPGQYGGWELVIAFIPVGIFSSINSCSGVGWIDNNVLLADIGTMQPGSTLRDTCGFAVDLLQRVPGSTQVFAPATYGSDPNNAVVIVAANTASTVGETPRFTELWCGVLSGFGSTVSTVPSPLTAVTGVTQLSSATLNTSIRNTFNLLNNPPMLNCQLQSNQAATANTITVVGFNATPLLDNYSAYNVSTFTYTVPLNGIYFCHANIIFAVAFTTGTCVAGFKVNGTTYYGGGYNAVPVTTQNTGCAVTKILDLHAGDTVQVFVETSVTANLGTANVSHFIMTWMDSIATGTQTWTAPDVTGFLFQAGTQPGTGSTQLAGIMNSKLGNDINFLLNRPYCTVYQTTAQTSLGNNSFLPVTMQTVAGLIHNSNGDNYNGWSTANNYYVAQVPGWYLAVAEYAAATTATANSGNAFVAGFSVPTSGGVTAPTSPQRIPDWYQHITVTNSWTYPTGATAIGCYYLAAGEIIAPAAMYQQAGSVATWGTDVTHGFNSHFNVLWLSNL